MINEISFISNNNQTQSEVKHLYSKIYFNSQVQIEICTRTPNIC